MRITTICWVIPILTFAACNNAISEADRALLATADSTSFSSDIAPLNSPSRKRIRTADIRCRVSNVFIATTEIERFTQSLEGIIVESALQNETSQVKEFSYGADSIRRTQIYTPIANLTVKVPVQHLDSILNKLSASAQFISNRTLKQEDVTFRYLANALKNETAVYKQQPSPGIVKTKELPATKYMDSKQDNYIDRRMENLRLLDDTEYSTFTMQLFQSEVVDIQTVADPSVLSRAGFGTEILTALHNGVELLRAVLLFIIRIWPVWAVGILVWIGYRNFRRFLVSFKQVNASIKSAEHSDRIA